MAVYTHNTPKRYTSDNVRGRVSSFTRALMRLRTRIRNTSTFVTAERIYSEAWPAFGGSLGTQYLDGGGSHKKIIAKQPRNGAVGKPVTNLK